MDQRFASSLPRPFVSALVLIFALASAEACGETPAVPVDRELPRLPEPVSSFGAVVEGGALYVYSGHIGDAHAHSAKNLSHRFQRLVLAGAGSWESLPVGPALQSPALVSHRGGIYRVGGLAAQ